jgi:hypothetical protein
MVEALSFLMAPIVENKRSTVKCVLTTYILLGIMHRNASITRFWSDIYWVIHRPSHSNFVANIFSQGYQIYFLLMKFTVLLPSK